MPLKAAGPLRADEYYPKAELQKRSGWGDSALRSARRDGLRPIYANGRVFFKGADVIAYLDKVAAEADVKNTI